MRSRKPKGPKKVSYRLIPREADFAAAMYTMLDELVGTHHQQLRDARIALAWCTSWKPDVDGRVTLGKCKKASDLDRELAAFDFIILLSKGFWESLAVTDKQRAALLDHELCHAEVKLDPETGDPTYDERGRIVYRMRKHDIEEFSEIVERHGCYKRDLERFAAALRRAALKGYVPCDKCRDTGSPGWTKDEAGALKRCACWRDWQLLVASEELGKTG